MSRIVYNSKPKSSDPVKQIRHSNGKGYLDLILSVTKNGKAVRIANREGTERVFVTLKEVNGLIEDLKLIARQGVKTSVGDVEYASGTAAKRKVA